MEQPLIMCLIYALFIFGIVIYIRNKIYKVDEYSPFKKGDIFILLLVIYTLFILVPIEIKGIHKDVLIDTYYYNTGFEWMPFRNLELQQDYYKFLINIGKSSYELLTLPDYLFYYGKLMLISLPIAFLLYVVTKRKWVGFIFNIAILFSCYKSSGTYYIGDGLLMGIVGYLFVLVCNKSFKKVSIKYKSWFNYIIFGALVALVLIFVVHFDRYLTIYDEELVKTVPFDKHIKTYDDLITVNLEDVSLIQGDYPYKEYLCFSGELDFDESFFEKTPFDLKRDVLKDNIRVIHEYLIEGNKHSTETNNNKFNSRMEQLFFNQRLKFWNYSSYKDDNEIKIDTDKTNYFEYYGISNMSIGLNNAQELSELEILKEGFGTDKYMYYEVIYKLKKFKGYDVKWFVNIKTYDKNSNSIQQEFGEDEIIEETNEYIVKRKKYYYYKVDREDIDRVEVKVDDGRWYIGEKDVELLFTIDKEIFE
ncbi:MAG: hypothetical protein N4A63_09065 [Vallitalea sp.]|jgi:hypothetical protein|nr:hypothetical protein [Vallitalea sp.]